MSRLTIVDNLRIASPCDASWADMSGDAQSRFCGACEKNVYDLTTMEPDDIVSLIEATEGKFCGRLYKRADGTVLTEDCPVGLARVLRKAKRRTYQAAAFALTLIGSAASLALYGTIDCAEVKPVQALINTIETNTPPPLMMGEMEPLEPPPLGKLEPVEPPPEIREVVMGGMGAEPEPVPMKIMGDVAYEPEK
jgi:hypothetical protein